MVTPLLQYPNLKICINILEIGVLHAFTKKVLMILKIWKALGNTNGNDKPSLSQT